MASLLASRGGEVLARELIEELVTSVIAYSAERQADMLSYELCSESVRRDMMCVVDWYWLAPDKGPSAARGVWDADDEPIPSAADTWSRDVIPVNDKKKDVGPQVDPLSSPSRHQSSRGAHFRRTTSEKSSVVSDPSNLGLLSDLRSISEMGPVIARKLKGLKGIEGSASTKGDSARQHPQNASAVCAAPNTPPSGSLPLDSAAACTCSLGVQAADIYAHTMVELQGKEYTYDEMDRAIVVKKVDGEKLGALRHSPRYAVLPTAQEKQLKPRARGKKGRGNAAAENRASSSARVSAPDTIEKLESSQPLLAESMSVQPGVSVRQGTSTLQSQRISEEAHMSLREFELLANSGAPVVRTPRATTPNAVAQSARAGEPLHATKPDEAIALGEEHSHKPQRSPRHRKHEPDFEKSLGHRMKLPRERARLAQPGIAFDDKVSAAFGVNATGPRGRGAHDRHVCVAGGSSHSSRRQ